ncbi:unnamed protein product, partial [Rotaria sordida]
TELAKRQDGEALFNILPDIFSNLVGGKLDKQPQLNEEDFKSIIEFLFKYVSKEKQTESLLKILLQRFQTANDSPRLCRDLAYIMSKLTFNKQSLKGCLSNLPPTKFENISGKILNNASPSCRLANSVKNDVANVAI